MTSNSWRTLGAFCLCFEQSVLWLCDTKSKGCPISKIDWDKYFGEVEYDQERMMQLFQNLVQPRKFPMVFSMFVTLLSALLQPCRLHSLGYSRTTDSTGGRDEKSRASKCMHHKPYFWSLVR